MLLFCQWRIWYLIYFPASFRLGFSTYCATVQRRGKFVNRNAVHVAFPSPAASLNSHDICVRLASNAAEFSLSNRLIANHIRILNERRPIRCAACLLLDDFSIVALEPSPIAKLMQLEVLAVEQIHSTRFDKSVCNERNTVVRQRLKTSVEIHIVHVGSRQSEIVEICSSYVVRTYDKVDLRACNFVDIVYCALNFCRGNSTDVGILLE